MRFCICFCANTINIIVQDATFCIRDEIMANYNRISVSYNG